MATTNLKPLFTWRSAIVESNLKPTTRHVLLTLSLHMNERGGSCFPSVETLARETDLNRATIIRQLQIAETDGWLVVERSAGRTSNRYEAAIPSPSATVEEAATVAHNDGCEPSNRRPLRPSHKTTVAEDEPNRRFDEVQPSFSVRPTVAQNDPSTSVTLQKNSPRGRQSLAGAAAPARRPDHAFDALCEVTATNPAELTNSARGPLNRALAEIRGAWHGPPDDLPDEIRRRAGRYLVQMRDCRLTAPALAKHWPSLAVESERLQTAKARGRVLDTVDAGTMATIARWADPE